MLRAPYSPATRLLTILDLLQSRPSLTAERLADALGVAPRSARRYITMLQDMGIPIVAQRGRYGGYALRPGYKLPPLMLSDEEALAVTIGLLAARGLGIAEMESATAGALAKLERVQAISDAVALDQRAASQTDAPPAPQPSASLIALCSAASRLRRRLWLRYQQRDGPETERTLDCYGVVYHGERWYAIGFCHLRQQMRTFRLDRVRDAALRDETFTRPTDFDCLAYAIQAFAAIPDRWLVQALLATTFEQVCRQTPPDFATLEETPEGVILRAYDRSLDHAAQFLAGLGCPFTVIAPPELRQALRVLADRLIEAT